MCRFTCHQIFIIEHRPVTNNQTMRIVAHTRNDKDGQIFKMAPGGTYPFRHQRRMEGEQANTGSANIVLVLDTESLSAAAQT